MRAGRTKEKTIEALSEAVNTPPLQSQMLRLPIKTEERLKGFLPPTPILWLCVLKLPFGIEVGGSQKPDFDGTHTNHICCLAS